MRIVILMVTLLGVLFASYEPKQRLQRNYELLYADVPHVTTLSDMFSEGEWYARVRSNTLGYRFNDENEEQHNSLSSAIGGSLILQSARYTHFDMQVGLYYSRAFLHVDDNDVHYLKGASDLLSRYDYIRTGRQSLAVVGQAYVQYSGIADSYIRVGRQLVESFYTRSNDSKMIPNTFDALLFHSNALPKTSLTIAYLLKEKLRGHSRSHALFAYGDANASDSIAPYWSENDDSVMHQGITYGRLVAAGIDPQTPLLLVEACSDAMASLHVRAAYYLLPKLLSSAMLEANYRMDVGSHWSITPGVRLLEQFDEGAGDIGGAAYDGSAEGYRHRDSLHARMVAARLVTRYRNYQINMGYSKVFDKADIIAPWRGFPTAGYTRSMSRYNWMANTQSYRIELQINPDQEGVYNDLFIQASWLYTDADERKGFYDEHYYYVGLIKNLRDIPQLQGRLRLGYQESEQEEGDGLDVRIELNYLF